jgi:hypothetical protein
MSYADLLLGGNLNVHAKPEKIMYICLLKVKSMELLLVKNDSNSGA